MKKFIKEIVYKNLIIKRNGRLGLGRYYNL